MLDIRRAIEALAPSAKWDFSVPNEGGNEQQYNAITWTDERTKPTWAELVAVAEGFAAADLAAVRLGMSVGPLQLAQALDDMGLFETVNTWANAQGGMVAYAWNRATQFERLHPMVLAAQAEFEWTDEQVDALLALAATK